jgi:hypothetical protein
VIELIPEWIDEAKSQLHLSWSSHPVLQSWLGAEWLGARQAKLDRHVGPLTHWLIGEARGFYPREAITQWDHYLRPRIAAYPEQLTAKAVKLTRSRGWDEDREFWAFMDELAIWEALSYGDWQPVEPKGADFRCDAEKYDVEVTQVSQPFMDHLREVLSRQTWWSGYKLTISGRLDSEQEVDEALRRIRKSCSVVVGTANWTADYQDKLHVSAEYKRLSCMSSYASNLAPSDAVRLVESKLQHKVHQKAENFQLAVAVCFNDIFDVYTGPNRFFSALDGVHIPHELIGWYGFFRAAHPLQVLAEQWYFRKGVQDDFLRAALPDKPLNILPSSLA